MTSTPIVGDDSVSWERPNRGPAGEGATVTPFERYRHGDPTAAIGVADAYVAACYRLALTLLDDPAAAEAATRDGLQVALELAPAFDPERDDERRWVIGFVRRKAMERARIDANRRPWPGQGRSLNRTGLEPDAARRLHGLTPADAAAAVARLQPNQAVAVWRAFAQGQRPDQIAAAVGAPVAAVRERLRQGLQDIQDQLGAPHEVAQ